jgi:hypothetical protein
MTDTHKKLPPADKKPGEVPPEVPETEAPQEDFVEGELPGLPVSNDPLAQPMPIPEQREKPPLD